MRDLQAVIKATQNDVALAAYGLADAVDILAILDMALDSRMEDGAPFTQICTVLNKALENARAAREAAQRVSAALTKELRFIPPCDLPPTPAPSSGGSPPSSSFSPGRPCSRSASATVPSGRTG